MMELMVKNWNLLIMYFRNIDTLKTTSFTKAAIHPIFHHVFLLKYQ